MIVITAIRKLLQDTAAVSSYATGGIHMVEVEQDSARPNAMIMLISGSDGWTHDGPDGLNQDLLRIYSRGDTLEQAITMADHIKTALNGYVASTPTYTVDAQLIQHVNRNGDYQDEAKVYRQIDDYRVHYCIV